MLNYCLNKFQSEKCWLTQNGADYGADVVLNPGEEGNLWYKCKHTNGRSYDGYRAVTEVHAAKVKYEEELDKIIDTLIFATNADRLSKRCKRAATQYEVTVLDGKGT